MKYITLLIISFSLFSCKEETTKKNEKQQSETTTVSSDSDTTLTETKNRLKEILRTQNIELAKDKNGYLAEVHYDPIPENFFLFFSGSIAGGVIYQELYQVDSPSDTIKVKVTNTQPSDTIYLTYPLQKMPLIDLYGNSIVDPFLEKYTSTETITLSDLFDESTDKNYLTSKEQIVNNARNELGPITGIDISGFLFHDNITYIYYSFRNQFDNNMIFEFIINDSTQKVLDMSINDFTDIK